jgi:hypothetical protein
VASEDPDGSKLKTMLAERCLYIFDHRATVKKWKHRRNITKGTSKENSIEYPQDVDRRDDEDVEITITPAAQPSNPTLPINEESKTSPPASGPLNTSKATRTPNPPRKAKGKQRY